MRRTLRGSLVMLSATLTASVLLTACGGGSSDSSGSSADPAPKPGEKIELNYWSWAPDMDKTVDVWNKSHPDIHVTVNKQDGGDPAVAKLLTAIKAGSGAPDVMQAEYQALPTMVAAGALADIKADLPRTPRGTSPTASGTRSLSHRRGLRGTAGLRPVDVLLPRRRVQEGRDQGPDHLGRVRGGSQDDPREEPQAVPRYFLLQRPGWFAGLTQQNGASWWGVDGQSWSVNIDSAESQKVASFWGNLVEQGVIDNTPMYTPGWNKALNNGTQVGWVSAVWARCARLERPGHQGQVEGRSAAAVGRQCSGHR